MDISAYTQSERVRIEGKHLTRLAKNSIAAATYSNSNPASRVYKLLVGLATAAAVAGYKVLEKITANPRRAKITNVDRKNVQNSKNLKNKNEALLISNTRYITATPGEQMSKM